jgi:hypothetical protein
LIDDVAIRFIPEPSAAIPALFGGLLALRRRRWAESTSRSTVIGSAHQPRRRAASD